MIFSIIIPLFGSNANILNILKIFNSQISNLNDDILIECLIVNTNKDPFFINFPISDQINLIIFHEPNLIGSYSARNYALKKANSENIFFLDSDCIPSKNLLGEIVELIKSKYEVIGGRIVSFSERCNPNFWDSYDLCMAFPQSYIVPRNKIVATNLLVKKKIFDEIGLFNQTLYSGGDTEWSNRCQKKQIQFLYKKNLIIYHPTRSSFSELFRKNLRINHYLYFRKNQNFFYKIYAILFQFRLPINSLKVIIQSNQTVFVKIQAISILLLLRLCYASWIFLNFFNNLEKRRS